MNAADLMKALNDDDARKAIPAKEGDAPHYLAIGPGQAIGYRPKRGSWCARVRVQLPVAAGQKPRHELRYTTLKVPAGASYPAAFTAACEWMKEETGRAVANAPRLGTVAKCMEMHVANLRLLGKKSEKRIQMIENQLRNVTLDPVGAIDCEELTKLHITEWRERMLRGDRVMPDARFKAGPDGKLPTVKRKPLRPQSVNRTWNDFLAALNWAFAGGRIISTKWQGISTLDEVMVRPGMFIELEHQRQLLALAKKRDATFHKYMVCIMLTGARPVELERVEAADISEAKRVPTVRLWGFKGQNSEYRERFTGIPAEALAAFKWFAANKIGKAKVFPYRDNVASGKFRALAKELGMPYEMYDTRHTRIASLLRAHVDPQTVATQLGTSLQMIDRHYRKDLPGQDAAQLVAAAGF